MSKLKYNNVLITGIDGFLGRNLTQKLKSYPISIVGLSKTVKDKITDKVKYYKIDIIEKEELIKLFSNINLNFDIIFHFASVSSTSQSKKNPDLTFKTNVLGTYNLLYTLNAFNQNPFFVFPSTVEVYGGSKKISHKFKEEEPIKPQTPYGLTKKMCEDLFQYFKLTKDVKSLILRLTNIYGRYLNNNFLIESIISNVLNNKKIELKTPLIKRQFLHIDDLINLFTKIMTTQPITGIFNVGGISEYHIHELPKLISEILREKNFENLPRYQNILSSSLQNLKDKDILSYCLNYDKIIVKYNWMPKIDFKEGVYNILSKQNRGR